MLGKFFFLSEKAETVSGSSKNTRGFSAGRSRRAVSVRRSAGRLRRGGRFGAVTTTVRYQLDTKPTPEGAFGIRLIPVALPGGVSA